MTVQSYRVTQFVWYIDIAVYIMLRTVIRFQPLNSMKTLETINTKRFFHKAQFYIAFKDWIEKEK